MPTYLSLETPHRKKPTRKKIKGKAPTKPTILLYIAALIPISLKINIRLLSKIITEATSVYEILAKTSGKMAIYFEKKLK
jgi:hypothetical protein